MNDIVTVDSYGNIADSQRLNMWHPSDLVGRKIVNLQLRINKFQDPYILLELEDPTKPENF